MLLREWASGQPYHSSAERTVALRRYGFLVTSTPTMTTLLFPRFCAEWVTPCDSVRTSPGRLT